MADGEPDAGSLDRDQLALERTRLANERTALAYARTAIMLAATGATLILLYAKGPLSLVFGWLLVAAGVAVGGLGARRFLTLARRLD